MERTLEQIDKEINKAVKEQVKYQEKVQALQAEYRDLYAKQQEEKLGNYFNVNQTYIQLHTPLQGYHAPMVTVFKVLKHEKTTKQRGKKTFTDNTYYLLTYTFRSDDGEYTLTIREQTKADYEMVNLISDKVQEIANEDYETIIEYATKNVNEVSQKVFNYCTQLNKTNINCLGVLKVLKGE